MPIEIKIAAENIKSLRQSDVFRVLDEALSAKRKMVSNYITENRPDLATEVSECLEDLAA
jgi:uncharacterized protein YqeY